MHKLFKKVSAFAAAAMMSLSLPVAMVRAEETDAEPTVLNGATYDTAVHELGEGKYKVVINITVNEDTDTDTVMVHPFYELELNNVNLTVQPGDWVDYEVHLNDHSGQNYEILTDSLNVTANIPNTENGELQRHDRAINDALVDLGLDTSDIWSGSSYSDFAKVFSDAKIGAALKAKGYGADENLTNEETTVKYLGQYYLDYYNQTHDAELTDLGDLPASYLDELFNGYNKLTPNRPVSTGRSETCPDVKNLHYYYAVKYAFTVDGTGVMLYAPASEPNRALENKFKAAYNTENGAEFQYKVDGYAVGNIYQNTVAAWGLSLMLAKPGFVPEEKIDRPDLDKTIENSDSNDKSYTTVKKGEDVEFKLTSHVGKDLEKYLDLNPAYGGSTGEAGTETVDKWVSGKYTLTFEDKLDPDLIYKEGSMVVTVNGKEVNVQPTVTTAEDGRQLITVSLDLADLFLQGGYFTEEEIGTAPIEVTYKATAKEDIKAGRYFNTARVIYEDGESEWDTVTIETFGLKVFKFDQTTNDALKDAEFELYTFDEDGNKVVIATGLKTGEDGYFQIEGLKKGTYWLLETKAPEGFVKSDQPLEIIVDREHSDEFYFVHANFANAPVPHTGGMGTTLFTLGGGLLVVAAGILLIARRRAERENA